MVLKSQTEIEIMHRANAVLRETFALLAEVIKPGWWPRRWR